MTLSVYFLTSFLAVSRSIAGCSRGNIGEVTRSGGGVDFYQKLFSYFFTVHRGDRNVFVDKKYIAEIHFHPMNFLQNH
ncbi:hypothetical protein HMPREF9448_02739 [Barnesiella intestinihominis YIT 11860]|uniref:Uncharacterized protein n=1 Tax=Barnesiella intestinihominis YIT 11860 TaxID=742726 RepID=K0WRT7_9BACT|nr:hypothetical protein HMPREF9448_02739 [Barnesiella intestinihominis YIT 11860]